MRVVDARKVRAYMPSMSDTILRIGTAGWSVPSRYAGEIPQGGSHLERYARRFNAVEINSS